MRVAGNFLILATDRRRDWPREAAVEAIRVGRGRDPAFPGGVVRSGSKVGSKYKKLV